MRHLKLSMGIAAGAIALGAVAFVARPSIAQAFSGSALAALATPDPNGTQTAPGWHNGGGLRDGPGGAGSLIEATVTVTGLTRDEVLTDLKNGQTLTQIAESKGKTAAEVIAAARTELQTHLAQDVTDGRIAQADADAKLKAFDDSASAAMTSTTLGQMPQGGFGFGGPGFGHGGRGLGGPQSLIEATVSVTGLTRDEVFTDLQAGQSLAQIATSQGKTADAVIAAARTQLQDSLKQAVTDGKLTQDQADSALADFDKTATETVNSTTLGQGGPGAGGPGFDHDGFGRGGGAGSLIEATVTVTGLTRQEVFTDLQNGQTLTQIVESKGKTAADVIASARTQLDTQLKQAVTAGKLTQADADAKLKAFDDSASATMTSTTLGQMPQGGFGGHHGGPGGFGGPNGGQPPSGAPTDTAPTGGSGA